MSQRPAAWKDVPLSEATDKRTDMSPEELISDLRRIAMVDETRVITRNFYRVFGQAAESNWSAHFGSFLEFKRQANIIVSRHAHRMERDVAKHASVANFREMNIQKSGYEDKYLRPSGSRFQTLIHITDVHDIDCDPFWRRVLMETIARVQPEKIIIGGDLFDLPEFSKYSVDPREWNVVGRIQYALSFLRQMRLNAPNAEMILIEGNHEFRLLRHLSEATPALRAVLSDLHGFTIPKLLGLDEFEINYVSRSDLGTFTQRDIREEVNRNWYVAWDCYLAHHFPEGKQMGYPGAHGHHHRYEVTQHYSPQFGSFVWSQLGCGHRRRADYCAGERWGLGFQIVHVDTTKRLVLPEYVTVNEMAMVGGRWYERLSTEQ